MMDITSDIGDALGGDVATGMMPITMTNPQAAVVVWNYRDRMTPPGAKANTQDLTETIILSASVTAIQTRKTKALAAGAFEITLAPIYNWGSRLTIGSWIAILMSKNEPIQEGFINKGAQRKTLKLLGRIDSVRTAVSVVQDTGARSTQYIVTGRDWGGIFDSTVYIDTAAFEPEASALSTVTSFLRFLTGWADKEGGPAMYSTTELIQQILKLYGGDPQLESDGGIGDTFSNLNQWMGIPAKPDQVFQMPKEVASFLNMGGLFSAGQNAKDLTSLIKIVAGKLVGENKYSGDQREAQGMPNINSFMGEHNFWQILVEHSGPVLNELIADLRWTSSGVSLALYNRIRPFAVRPVNNILSGIGTDFKKLGGAASNAIKGSIGDLASQQEDAEIITKHIFSPFHLVKRVVIPLEDIISINAGTNWENKINFIEVMGDLSSMGNFDSFSLAPAKLQAQIYDKEAPRREGLKPMILRSKFFPDPETAGKSVGRSLSGKNSWFLPQEVTKWKYLLKEWYFNVHNMFDGVVSFIGQDDYISVGDNIAIDAQVLNMTINDSDELDSAYESPGDVYLLAHVEGVSHAFTVGPDGARSFLTTVHFVRGVWANSDFVPISYSVHDSQLEATPHDDYQPFKNQNVQSTSTYMDPDTHKRKGG